MLPEPDMNRGPVASSGPSHRRVWIARGIAIAADALQIGIFPLFGEGIASPLDIGLDVAVFAALVMLVGPHFAFLPSIVAEIVPGLDLFPTWTAAVLFVTRKKK